MLKKMLHRYSSYLAHEAGVAAIVLALALPMLIASAGVGLDLAMAYNAKNRLSHALDKATLAAASTNGTEAEMRERMQAFFDANYPEGKFGTPYDVDIVFGENSVTVTAHARVNARFLKMFGQDTINVSAESQVVRALAGVEAVLVLDVTGSMAGNNITALKTASRSFINLMFDEIDDPAYIKIGIVPWSNAVNVGTYGKGLKPDGSYYGQAFVDNPTTDYYTATPENIAYGKGSHDWAGCVIERSAASAVLDTSSPNWQMYRYSPTSCAKTQCTAYNWWGQCSNSVCIQWSGNPNNGCPTSPIMPLSNDRNALLAVINGLQTGGNTYSNLGMVWGWRVISPGFPFTEGAPYDDRKWSKTVILMTDGDNVISSQYSGEGAAGTPGISTTTTQQNQKMATICSNMKAEGIRIYTITFQSGINNTTKNYYKNCATSPAMYFDAPSNQKLVDAFSEIAKQLSQLHITK